MIRITDASVIDVVDDLKNKLNKAGIKRYSKSKNDEICDIFIEYTEKEVPSKVLKGIILTNILDTIIANETLNKEKILDGLTESSNFLAITKSSLEDVMPILLKYYFMDWDYGYEMFPPMNERSKSNFLLSRKSVNKMQDFSEEQKSQYNDVVNAWLKDKIPYDKGELVNIDNIHVTNSAKARIDKIMTKGNEFSRLKNYLYDYRLNWVFLDDPIDLDEDVNTLMSSIMSIILKYDDCFNYASDQFIANLFGLEDQMKELFFEYCLANI